MNEVRDVTGTAFVVAEFRARENAEAHPLYRDPIVPIFLDERTRREADAISDGFPAAASNVRLRTRYFDDRLDEQLANGCRQVVILGAGLDTRAARKRAPGVAYFEIDDVNTLSFKEVRLAENRIPAEVTYIPGDYVAAGVLDLLDKNGFKRELPTFFIWEGNTTYLGPVMQVLAEVKESVPTFAMSFDFMDEDGRADDRRCTRHDFCRALRGDGRTLASRHRRFIGSGGRGSAGRRRRDDGGGAPPRPLARPAFGFRYV